MNPKEWPRMNNQVIQVANHWLLWIRTSSTRLESHYTSPYVTRSLRVCLHCPAAQATSCSLQPCVAGRDKSDPRERSRGSSRLRPRVPSLAKHPTPLDPTRPGADREPHTRTRNGAVNLHADEPFLAMAAAFLALALRVT